MIEWIILGGDGLRAPVSFESRSWRRQHYTRARQLKTTTKGIGLDRLDTNGTEWHVALLIAVQVVSRSLLMP